MVRTAVLCLILLSGCASAPPVDVSGSARLFDDARFKSAPVREIGDDPFAVSESMREYLAGDIASRMRITSRQRALFDALYRKDELKLEYDSTLTRSAAQAFEARAGNCLSLVLLTAALARELGLKVQFQTVYTDQTMTRSGGIVYLSGHVNLTLGSQDREGRFVNQGNDAMTIDFLPSKQQGERRARVIREATILAMYFNNRAAEALAAGTLDDAYWWLRKAIQNDPTFMPAYNTLGVIYKRHGDLVQAETAFNYVIEREPGNATPISNLIAVLNESGRSAEAAPWARKLQQIEPYPPFHFFDLGMAAMKAKDYPAARDLFSREVARAAYYHEFHAWLAAAQHELGQTEMARKHLQIALINSSTPAEHALYASRIEAISAKRRLLRSPEASRR